MSLIAWVLKESLVESFRKQTITLAYQFIMSKQAKITINQVKIILVNPDNIVFSFPLLVYLYQKHFIWINTESPQLDERGSERRKSEHRKVRTSKGQNIEKPIRTIRDTKRSELRRSYFCSSDPCPIWLFLMNIVNK